MLSEEEEVLIFIFDFIAGGSGGSIRISAPALSGSGLIEANGGLLFLSWRVPYF